MLKLSSPTARTVGLNWCQLDGKAKPDLVAALSRRSCRRSVGVQLVKEVAMTGDAHDDDRHDQPEGPDVEQVLHRPQREPEAADDNQRHADIGDGPDRERKSVAAD